VSATGAGSSGGSAFSFPFLNKLLNSLPFCGDREGERLRAEAVRRDWHQKLARYNRRRITDKLTKAKESMSTSTSASTSTVAATSATVMDQQGKSRSRITIPAVIVTRILGVVIVLVAFMMLILKSVLIMMLTLMLTILLMLTLLFMLQVAGSFDFATGGAICREKDYTSPPLPLPLPPPLPRRRAQGCCRSPCCSCCTDLEAVSTSSLPWPLRCRKNSKSSHW
jgi:hypothetical protein